MIAQTPIKPRDSSRLLVYNRKDNSINHRHFFNVLDYLNKGDVLVLNNTRVMPARLIGKKVSTNANAEVFLLKKLEQSVWEVLLKPSRKLRANTEIKFSDDLSCVVLEQFEMGIAKVKFTSNGIFEEILSKIGVVPLPSYIHKKLKDSERYQTVYSKILGSSAAPTAGLHFTNELLQKIKDKGVVVAEVLLHVGLGTFRPVSEDNILNHQMHSEYYEINQDACDIIERAKQNGNKIVAVGTTSVRVLEAVASKFNGKLQADYGETNIFIYPGYKFKMVDYLITNFHLPESTLLMLVSAFCGIENTLNIYKTAVENSYRFYSFGDACLLL